MNVYNIQTCIFGAIALIGGCLLTARTSLSPVIDIPGA